MTGRRGTAEQGSGMAGEYGLKRHFDGAGARRLGVLVQGVRPDFDLEGYVGEAEVRVRGLELKDRVGVLAEGLRSRLPGPYPEAVAVLVALLGDELADGQGMFNNSWHLMPVARFVEEYGLDHPTVSLDALHEITRRHTGEYAVRPLVERHHDLTMKRVTDWAHSPSHHVRRLASEGIRPRLPWARTLTGFVADPRPVLAVLEVLRSDPSSYVRKSVANNLNDIARDHPDLVLATALRWTEESPTPETAWTVRHGLRTLVKQGNQQALALLGATGGEHAQIPRLALSVTELTVGETLALDFDIRNTDDSPHTLTVDYVVHHVRKGGRTIPKVFKLATVELAPGERRTLRKQHAVREITTRVYYPGEHVIDIQVNGLVRASASFLLRTP
ncbi:DNA alkylation repair protein [Streptomyces sp. NBC_00237]|uniref:DNA alkylation repair protein n=1 Tax=Streptomyces sp. NBC_00237 TaxID=2975687 RepID=UPI002252C5B0|nr:DNA alkylation repair protein [Streptomyces sp. NBC_00237]MCX5205201.1 DNA alkylation repair protein [Streptomyces sp. NBC_00237]